MNQLSDSGVCEPLDREVGKTPEGPWFMDVLCFANYWLGLEKCHIQDCWCHKGGNCEVTA